MGWTKLNWAKPISTKYNYKTLMKYSMGRPLHDREGRLNSGIKKRLDFQQVFYTTFLLNPKG